ncbi:MAG TPA: hypothetical protein O0X97_01190 [Methanocorpusculum sp.]|nr:hypothetical protein [Methanocorpusculum sp.]
MVQLSCPKCGAPLEVKAGTHIVICRNCQTPTYIDRSEAVFFYKIPFSVDETHARGIFRRWTAGPDMDKLLEMGAKITRFEKEYFPVFSFIRNIDGKESYTVLPAKGTALPGMRSLKIPPGNLETYTGGSLDAAIIQPDIALESCIGELKGEALSQSIIYFPIYDIAYTFKGENYSAVIDGSTGDIHSGYYPSRGSASFAGVMILAVILGILGGLLGVLFEKPLFFLLSLAGIIIGKLLGSAVVRKKPEVQK